MAGESPQNFHSVPVGLVVCLFGGAVTFIFWWANHRWVTDLWLWVEWVLLQPVKYTIGFLSAYPNALSADILKTIEIELYCPKNVADPNAVQFGSRVDCHNYSQNWKLGWWVSSRVGEYWRWVLVVLVSIQCWKLWKDPLKRFRGNITVTDFLKMQSKLWKPIVPFLHRDLIEDGKEDYRVSRDPEELAIAEKVVIGLEKDSAGNTLREGVFQEKEARRVLAAQLGPAFKKENFTEVEKALFVIFALRINRQPKEAKRLFDAINNSMDSGKPAKLSFASDRFDEMFELQSIKLVAQGHGYVSTVLFEMLVQAVQFDGLLAPSEFLAWVKPSRRSLWYALNRAPADKRLEIASFAEGQQIVCQWQAESVAKQSGLQLKGVFYDRAILAWKESLYKSGAISEEVKNLNAAALQNEIALKEQEKAEKARAAKRGQSRFLSTEK